MKNETMLCPFTVLIDSAEQEAFGFTGIKADAAKGGRCYEVPTERQSLGRYPNSLGDYSLSGGAGRCHIERKSMADAHSTILGWDGHRDRFECELKNLAAIECGAVIVECSLEDLIRFAPSHGKKSVQENAKNLHRSIISFQQRFRVPWLFCGSRRLAELTAFHWLRRWHEKQREAKRSELKQTKFFEACDALEAF